MGPLMNPPRHRSRTPKLDVIRMCRHHQRPRRSPVLHPSAPQPSATLSRPSVQPFTSIPPVPDLQLDVRARIPNMDGVALRRGTSRGPRRDSRPGRRAPGISMRPTRFTRSPLVARRQSSAGRSRDSPGRAISWWTQWWEVTPLLSPVDEWIVCPQQHHCRL
jgi:hypothetical protein